MLAKWMTLPSEGQCPRGEIPGQRPQGRHLVSPQDDVIARQGHHKKIGSELCALDGDRGLANDAKTQDTLASSHHCCEMSAVLERKTSLLCCTLRDEILSRSHV